MEARSLKIFVMGLAGLVLVMLFSVYEKYFLVAMALTPLFLLIFGQFYLPSTKREVQVWFNPDFHKAGEEPDLPKPGTPIGKLSGRLLLYSFFKQRHAFEIVPRRFLLRAGIGLVSLAGVWIVHGIANDPLYQMAFYYSNIFWMILSSIAFRWLWERRMLRLTGLAIGSFGLAAKRGGPFQRVLYWYRDAEGHYRGGCANTMFCDRSNTMTLIFFDPENPDRNFPAAALMFHKLVWKDAPARQPGAEPESELPVLPQ